MNDKEQTAHLEAELNRLIERFRREYEISYAVVIGVLAMKQMSMHREAHEADE